MIIIDVNMQLAAVCKSIYKHWFIDFFTFIAHHYIEVNRFSVIVFVAFWSTELCQGQE